MGQKVNPIGLRLGVNRTWDSRWYANTKDYARLLHEDIKIRKFLREKLKAAGVSKIIIERPLKKCRVTISTAKPGVVIGKKGTDIEKLRKDLAKMAPDAEVHLNLVEVRKPETDANLVAEGVAQQLERRVAFRRAMKRAMQSAIDNAENNHSLDLDGLVVAQAHVGKNIVMRRMHARARGRGVHVQKFFSQLTIVLRDTTKQPEAA